jgi:hypothetical protein
VVITKEGFVKTRCEVPRLTKVVEDYFRRQTLQLAVLTKAFFNRLPICLILQDPAQNLKAKITLEEFLDT